MIHPISRRDVSRGLAGAIGMTIVGKLWQPASAQLTFGLYPAAEETGVANDQNPEATVGIDNCVDGEVCTERASDFASWRGVDAKALLPAIQGGDVVGRVRARFTADAFRNDYWLRLTTCEAQFGPDRCWWNWMVYPVRDACIGTYCNYQARDKNSCWRINDKKKFYTRVDFFDGSGQQGPRIESGNMRTERACSE